MIHPTPELRLPVGLARSLHFLIILALILSSSFSFGATAMVYAASQDSFAGASALSLTPGTPFVDTPTNISAFTRDAVEVDGLTTCGSYPANPANTHSAWYTFTGPGGGGWLTLSTFNPGTNYDTVVQVWEGTVSAGTSVACNDDAIAGDRRSEATLQVTSGTQYLIAVRVNGTATLPGAPTLQFSAVFSATREVFVNQNTGFDGNTGSAALPVRTIQRGVNILPLTGGRINIADTNSPYIETVTIDGPVELNAGVGTISIANVILNSGAAVTITGNVSSPSITVNNGARVQDGVNLASSSPFGTVRVAPGTYTSDLTINRNVILTAADPNTAPLPTLQPATSSSPAIRITGGNVTVVGFNITTGGNGVGVLIEGGAAHQINRNNITGNVEGLVNNTGNTVNASRNFWGDASGPSGAGAGSGNSVRPNATVVTFRPWCSDANPTCTDLIGFATQLRFQVPGASYADQTVAVNFTPAVQIIATDDAGTPQTDFNGLITLGYNGFTGTFAAPGNPTFGNGQTTTTATMISGTLTITDVTLNRSGTYFLTASTPGLANAQTTIPVNVNAGPAASLALTSQPTLPLSPTQSFAAGTTLPNLTVEARDQFGNRAVSFNNAVGVGLTPNPGSLNGAGSPTNFTNGVANFTNLSVNTAGLGYTLTVTATGSSLPPVTSNPFNITAGPLSQFAFTIQPPAAVRSGANFQIVVTAQDAFGNTITDYNGSFTLDLETNPAPGGTLTGGGTVAFTNGVANLTLSVDRINTGYRLRASDGTRTVLSSFFNVTAQGLVFTVNPPASVGAGTGAGQPFSVTASAQDINGNLDTNFNGIQVTLTTNNGTPLFGAPVTATAVNGVVTFPAVRVDTVGSYTLIATPAAPSEVAPGTSTSFTVTPGTPATVEFSVQPPTQVRSANSFQVTAVLRDQFGNLATNSNGANGTLTLSANPGPGTLIGTTTTTFANGAATFDVSLDRAAAGYRLTVSAQSSSPSFGPFTAQSDPFAITASQLVFTTQPITSTAGQTLNIVIEARDILNQPDPNFTNTIVLALDPLTVPRGAVLGGNTTVNAVNGVASFGATQNVNITRVHNGYRLIASSNGLNPVTSTAFDITPGPVAQLGFLTTPGPTPAEAVFADQPVVEARDQFGNLATNFSGNITLALQTGTLGANLLPVGNLTVATTAGTATFSGLSIDRVGFYTLGATTTSPGVALAVSTPITITANRLSFTISPADTAVGSRLKPAPVVRAQDRFGGVDVTFTQPVSVTITRGTGTNGATLRGTRTVNAVAGIASFTDLVIDRVGRAYQLTTGSGTLPVASSSSFNIIESVTFIPTAINPPLPDLVGSFTLTPPNPNALNRTQITVTVTNTGKAPASNFWVDFYINPSRPPTANEPWNELCAVEGCPGIAWFVPGTLAPGESITLISEPLSRTVPNGYKPENTFWLGRLPRGEVKLFLYVDSWNRDAVGTERSPSAAVFERNENNNRFERTITVRVD